MGLWAVAVQGWDTVKSGRDMTDNLMKYGRLCGE